MENDTKKLATGLRFPTGSLHVNPSFRESFKINPCRTHDKTMTFVGQQREDFAVKLNQTNVKGNNNKCLGGVFWGDGQTTRD